MHPTEVNTGWEFDPRYLHDMVNNVQSDLIPPNIYQEHPKFNTWKINYIKSKIDYHYRFQKQSAETFVDVVEYTIKCTTEAEKVWYLYLYWVRQHGSDPVFNTSWDSFREWVQECEDLEEMQYQEEIQRDCDRNAGHRKCYKECCN